MSRIQKIKDKLQKIGKKVLPSANFLLDSSQEVRDELSLATESDRAQRHETLMQNFMNKK